MSFFWLFCFESNRKQRLANNSMRLSFLLLGVIILETLIYYLKFLKFEIALIVVIESYTKQCLESIFKFNIRLSFLLLIFGNYYIFKTLCTNVIIIFLSNIIVLNESNGLKTSLNSMRLSFLLFGVIILETLSTNVQHQWHGYDDNDACFDFQFIKPSQCIDALTWFIYSGRAMAKLVNISFNAPLLPLPSSSSSFNHHNFDALTLFY